MALFCPIVKNNYDPYHGAKFNLSALLLPAHSRTSSPPSTPTKRSLDSQLHQKSAKQSAVPLNIPATRKQRSLDSPNGSYGTEACSISPESKSGILVNKSNLSRTASSRSARVSFNPTVRARLFTQCDDHDIVPMSSEVGQSPPANHQATSTGTLRSFLHPIHHGAKPKTGSIAELAANRPFRKRSSSLSALEAARKLALANKQKSPAPSAEFSANANRLRILSSVHNLDSSFNLSKIGVKPEPNQSSHKTPGSKMVRALVRRFSSLKKQGRQTKG